MSQYLKAKTFLDFHLGTVVDRTAAVPPASGAAEDIFSIDGGRVLLTAFLGIVTVAIPAQSIDFDVQFDADAGSGYDGELIDTVIMDSAAAGTQILIAAGPIAEDAGNLRVGVPYGAVLGDRAVILPAGDIVLAVSGGGTIGSSARVTWHLGYVPIDDGAVVTAV